MNTLNYYEIFNSKKKTRKWQQQAQLCITINICSIFDDHDKSNSNM